MQQARRNISADQICVSFISGLYFRGKLAYANAFSEPRALENSVFLITATHGLLSPNARIGHDQLNEMAAVPIKNSDFRYRVPLERDVTQVAKQVQVNDEVVLLGSIATPKYIEPLSSILGERLMIPSSFIGRGDMSRGALMLRAIRDNTQLEYIPAGRASSKSA
jgi:hypothetical protein